MKKIPDWFYQWKMSFHTDLSKQAQEMIFSRKSYRVDHPAIIFNNSSVAWAHCQDYLILYLGKKLNFSPHIKEKPSKAYKGIGVIRTLDYVLSRHSLLTIYQSLIRLHLDYGSIIYDQPNNQIFLKMLWLIYFYMKNQVLIKSKIRRFRQRLSNT